MKSVFHILMAFSLFLGMPVAQAQLAESSELHQLLKKKDSLLFHAAFNSCDPETMATLFTEDFEFYHDKGGTSMGRETFLAPMYENCSGKTENWKQPSKRILVKNSLRVFPLRKDGVLYGAIQEGMHRFEFLNENQEYQKGDIARFTHVWMLQDDQWKIKRELSYDHQPASSYQIEN
ncbi:MAG: nuclear transport factor 2 family protein [Muriicola sp.]|nr:nuclear transport factor 2 family protein [Muriicola sp.]NNK11202.1 nuclear transport factor 2 family protein [Flavobacteriaceae bacterium]